MCLARSETGRSVCLARAGLLTAPARPFRFAAGGSVGDRPQRVCLARAGLLTALARPSRFARGGSVGDRPQRVCLARAGLLTAPARPSRFARGGSVGDRPQRVCLARSETGRSVCVWLGRRPTTTCVSKAQVYLDSVSAILHGRTKGKRASLLQRQGALDPGKELRAEGFVIGTKCRFADAFETLDIRLDQRQCLR